MQCRKMSNWKAAGKGSVQRYWLKNFTSLHPRIAVQLNCILDGEIPLPDWMTQQKEVQVITIDQYYDCPLCGNH